MRMRLAGLVVFYTKFDPHTQQYKPKELNAAAKLALERNFIKLLNEILLTDVTDGLKDEAIKKNYRALLKLMHPDKRSGWLPEVVWLEHHLPGGEETGICFKNLTVCFEKLTHPEHYQEVTASAAEVRTKAEFKIWLEHLRDRARTLTSREFYISLIYLYDQCQQYMDETGQIKLKGVKLLAKSIPGIFATYGFLLLAEELFVVYALCFVLLKGGQALERREAPHLKKIGQTVQALSVITATASTIVLARLLAMTFLASGHLLAASFSLSNTLSKLKLASTPATATAAPAGAAEEEEDLVPDLALVVYKNSEKYQFKNPQIKAIAQIFDDCVKSYEEQWLVSYRLGDKKRIAVEAFIHHLRMLDEESIPLSEILSQVQEAFDHEFKDKPDLCTGQTGIAIKQTKEFIDFLIQAESEPESLELEQAIVTYQP